MEQVQESPITYFKSRVDALKSGSSMNYPDYDERKCVYSYVEKLFKKLEELANQKDSKKLTDQEFRDIKDNFAKIQELIKKYSGRNNNWFIVPLHLLVSEEVYSEIYNHVYNTYFHPSN
jgi:hypothetical protein